MITAVEQGLLREDGDAAPPLHGVGVEEGIAVVHTAEVTQRTGTVEHRLGERGLAGIDVRQHPDHDMVPIRTPVAGPAMGSGPGVLNPTHSWGAPGVPVEDRVVVDGDVDDPSP